VTQAAVVDASVLIAYLDPNDVHHADAVEALVAVDQLTVHPLTLAEVLVHPTRQGVAATVLATLTAIGLVVSPLPIDPLALARLRVKSGLKMPDCVVVATATAHGLMVLTFDERLRRVVEDPPI
jgi:predicted nucleic acid-binding protein